MSTAMNVARQLDNKNIMLPEGRMLYPNLFRPGLPKGETDEKKGAWGVTLLIPKGSDLKALEAAIEATISDKLTPAVRAKSKIKSPLLATADQARWAHLADDFPIMLRVTSNAFKRDGGKRLPPQVMSAAMKQLTEEDEAEEVYMGRWARASCNPFFYDHPTGGKGVSLGLANVQILRDDEALEPGRVQAKDEFEAVDPADLADMEV